MNQETRQCQNCKQNFTIEPEDFAFYETMKVPPPTFCPDCRRQRRMFFRNERALYKRKCDAPGHTEEIVSVFSPDKSVTVYDDRYWWSDAWDPFDYGSGYDFSRPFFTQFAELLRRIPLINLSVTNMVNCSYCNVSEGDKDCFLVSASEKNERVSYSNRIVTCKDSLDLYIANADELCYEVSSSNKCYRLFFSRNCSECIDSAFLYNCVNCDHCFGCANLRNKSYYLFNQPFTRNEYEEKLKSFDLGSFFGIQKTQQEHQILLNKSIRRFAHILKSVDVTGDNIAYAKNCQYAFDLVGNPAAEDCRFIHWGGAGLKGCYDAGPGVGIGLETSYEVTDTGIQANRTFFTSVVYGSYDVYCSINCHGSHHLFGCYGIRNKEYCIFNRQYTKEEYEKLIPRITKHMNEMPYTDKNQRIYRYGEFFPADVSPFAYNEIIAQEYFPLTKEEAIAQGYSWQEPEMRDYKVTTEPENLPDHIKDVNDGILSEIISCSHQGQCNHQCTTAFRIVPQELDFYRRMNLALPRLCPNCRHYERLAQRNPLKLWQRKCQCAGQKSENDIYLNATAHFHGTNPCPNEFETTYAPERPEIVYCEQCYQSEVV